MVCHSLQIPSSQQSSGHTSQACFLSPQLALTPDSCLHVGSTAPRPLLRWPRVSSSLTKAQGGTPSNSSTTRRLVARKRPRSMHGSDTEREAPSFVGSIAAQAHESAASLMWKGMTNQGNMTVCCRSLYREAESGSLQDWLPSADRQAARSPSLRMNDKVEHSSMGSVAE